MPSKIKISFQVLFSYDNSNEIFVLEERNIRRETKKYAYILPTMNIYTL